MGRCSEFELFSNGESRLKQPVGIAIQGNHSRTTFTKRFSVYAREEYSGSDFFDEVLVGDTFSHALCLRNDSDLFAMSQFFCADRDLVPVSSRKVVLFLDGEYWADYYLTDKYNFKNFARRFGLLENNIVIIKNGEAPENMDEGRNPFLRIYVPEIEASSDEEFYDKYNDIVDIQSYIDFVCVNHYLSNIDITDVSNCIVWHTAIPQNNDYGDGRWRFISYDMDAVFLNPDFSYKEAFKNNLFVATASHQKPIREWIVWTLLCNNSVFRKQFVLSYTDMVNTTFSEKFVSYVLNDKGFYSDLASEFFKNRPAYAIPQVAKEFGLSGKLGTVTLSSNKDGSPIKLNTVTPELENGMWSGRYFTEYPVTVSANEDGFIRFEVTANGKTTKYTEHEVEIPVTEGGVNIHAVYE